MTATHFSRLLPANEMKTRVGGVSDMTIWRWLRKPDLGFPRPININGRNYWPEAELTAFIESRRARV